MSYGYALVTDTTSASYAVCTLNRGVQPTDVETEALISIFNDAGGTGAYVGMSVVIEGSQEATSPGNTTNWFPLMAIDTGSGALVTGTIALATNTAGAANKQYKVNCSNYSAVRVRPTVFGSLSGTPTGTMEIEIRGSHGTSVPFTSSVSSSVAPVRSGQSFSLGRGMAKAGTTSGWTVNAGNNLGTIATVAASQTSSTLVIPLGTNLHVGDTITGYKLFSSIQSAGNTVTLDAALRTVTIAAGATGTDAAVTSGAITQVSVTAATASTATVTGLSTVVAEGVGYYILATCTTGASTSLELSQVSCQVTTS